MSRYELTLSPDYCPDWTVVEGVRELFQNALDQEITMEDNKMFCSYDADEKRLSIGNKSSVLEVKSLLLGASTKANDSKTIGKFGEGYKVATLVLLRAGYTVTFFNYGAREVWWPKLINSRRYKARVLVFDVDKKHIWHNLPDNNLTIEIEGITPEDYEKIVESNLHLQELKPDEVFTMQNGRILTDDIHRSKVYVNGLFVCKYEQYKCGYDFKPACIKLDRDRKLVSDFDLKWLSSSMWGASESPKISELAAEGAADVAYIQHHISAYKDTSKPVFDKAYNSFREKYGENAVPVIDQDELEAVPEKYRPVMVPESYQKLITRSSSYTEPIKEPEPVKRNPYVARLEDWFAKVSRDMPGDLVTEFEHILDEMEEDYANDDKRCAGPF